MKKIFLFAVTLIGILFLSCNSIDSQISQYEKACKAGNYEEAMKIATDLDKNKDKMTEEQAMKLLNAAESCAESALDLYSESFSSDDDEEDEDDDF